MNKKFVSINMLVIITLLAFSMVQSNSAISVTQDEVTLIYVLPYDFAEYSVYTADSYATSQWQSAINVGLYKRSTSADRDYVPDLAASMPTVSEDLKSFTITLREDLVFSNGQPLTADDVVFSYKVTLTPTINVNDYGTYLGFMDNSSVVKNSDLEVTVTLNQTFAFPFQFLSATIIPEETFSDRYESCLEGIVSDCNWNNPDLSDIISAGPYVATNYDDTNQVVTVERNENYYGWNENSGNVDKIIYKKTTEKAAAIAELAAGDADIFDAQYIAGVDELSFLPGVSEVFVGDPSHQEIAPNHIHPVFGTGEDIPGNEAATEAEKLTDAISVRKAMSHVVDREFAANEISDGLAQPAATPMPSASLGWDATITPRVFDIDVAKGYMEDAGYDYSTLDDADSDGVYENFFFEITVMSPNTNPARNEWSSGWVLELPKIGIGVKEHQSVGWEIIIPRTFGYPVGQFDNGVNGLVPLYENGGYDVLFVGYGWDLDWNPQGVYDSSGSHAVAGGGNFMNFDLVQSDESLTSEVEELLLQYLSTLDFTDRIGIVEDLQQELYDNIPVIPILYPQSHWGFGSNIKNIDALLLSVSVPEWDLASKEDRVEDTTPTNSDKDTQSSDVGETDESDTPLLIGQVFTGLFGSVFIAIMRKRRS